MRKILISLVAAGVLLSAPAFAQDVGVSIGGGSGVTVGVGDRDVRRGHRYEGQRVYSDRYRTVDRSACSEVTVKKRMPDGTVVIRKSERC